VRGVWTEPPAGFIEVTQENMDTPVSPHFRLRQFLCKQAGGFPRYVVLDDRLPLKLEALLERARAAGLRVSGFQVMSGYRTPHYNRLLGNVKMSRHLWGAAADIYVDESPKDGRMDDLNADGVSNFRDTAVLAALAEELEADSAEGSLAGGLGRYASNAAHGPFVHVDVRGKKARW